MRDWTVYVRERLSLPDHEAAYEGRVVRELVAQLTDACEDGRARGLSDEEADRFAREQIGDWTSLAEAIRRAGRHEKAGTLDLASDALLARAARPPRWSARAAHLGARLVTPGGTLRGLGRRLVRQRWTVATSVLMLGLGIGSSTAVYSALHQILFRPLGIQDAGRLVELHQTTPPRLAKMGVIAEDDLPVDAMEAQRAENRALASIALVDEQRLALKVDGQDARRVRVDFISPTYFPTLGIGVARGRGFTGDDGRGAEPLAVISDRLWQRAFGRDPQVLGRTMLANGRFCRVVGVAPRPFTGHTLSDPTDVWMPWGAQPLVGLEVPSTGKALARLAPGASLSAAAAATASVSRRFRQGLSAAALDETGQHRVRPFVVDRQGTLEQTLPRPWLLLAASMLMLLLACANAVNLQLAELESRRREFASRAALGASRGVLLRQVLAENLVVGLAACVVGLGLAVPLLALLARIPSADMAEPLLEAGLHLPAVAFASALALVSAVAMAIVPAARASRTTLADVLKPDVGERPLGGWTGDALMVLQVALALALFAGATLVTRSLEQARHQDLGLRPDGVVGLRLHLVDLERDPRLSLGKWRRLREGAEALPGVQVAAVSTGFPLENAALTLIRTGDKGMVPAMLVGAGYFAVLGVPVTAGRELRPDEEGSGARVVVVNRSLAAAFWPGQEAVGRMLGNHRVVGVVADHATLRETPLHQPFAFVPAHPDAASAPCLLVRTAGKPEALFPGLLRLARDVDPNAPVLRLATLGDHLDGLHRHLRIASWLLGLCGLASLTLAAMGVQSLLAFRVARRTREIGLRVALGATPRAAVLFVVGRVLRGVLVGLVLGHLGALAMTRAFTGLFVGAASLEPGSLALATAVLLGAALAAAIGPGWRTTRIDPASALRRE